ncbi:GlxA family transcriptional regulator [Phenylobacterium montanum]|uniref:GlxA family transcriptional regulator n=1 Tax=Phenylobacterium montanum TaxID=2823693 RepID=A0A975G1M2_9CAUL|nr:GlxA family transcriptional regulator [Caulobacter sp. S6]QUD88331.1 GlxA family transcriptional regulator [Caulobacter sp. S6]
MTRPEPGKALSIGVILAENFTLSAFSLFVDQLRLAADEGDLSRPILCSWKTMASDPDGVKASCGVKVGGTSPLSDPTQFDYIAVVGGLLHAGKQVDQATIAYLKQAAAAHVPLIGICTGSFILARAGLMHGRRCCVSWYHRQDFIDEFPDHLPVADRMFVVDGDRITCSGGGGAADLASWLIEKRLGAATAQKARHVLLLDRARHGNDAQPHPPISTAAPKGVEDPRVRRALLMMEQHLTNPMPITEIADRLRLSTRHLERLFRDAVGVRPAIFYRELRLRYARWLLDHTDRSVTDIALEAGFADCAHFSRQFKAMAGVSPSERRTAARQNEIAPAFMTVGSHHLAGVRLFE